MNKNVQKIKNTSDAYYIVYALFFNLPYFIVITDRMPIAYTTLQMAQQ
jgi:hypothetical protein